MAKRFTHLGQLKGSKGGYMIKGDPIYSLTANNDGLMVRFSNLESIDDFYPGFDKHLDWKKALGQWVHVKITTVFGKSMKVTAIHVLRGGVGGGGLYGNVVYIGFESHATVGGNYFRAQNSLALGASQLKDYDTQYILSPYLLLYA